MLRDVVGFDELKKKVVNPLKGRKIGAYYGCMLLRPSREMQFDNPENPTIIEDFIKAIGGTPVLYPFRNECCGGYVTLSKKELAQKKADMILESAMEKGCLLYTSFLFGFFYRHIASTSAMICLVENPFRSIAPDGQVTVQAPQP